jgi:hypothetical protein
MGGQINMTIAAPCYLVEILLPTETGNGKPVDPRWFESLLTAEFGGATSFLRAPGQGLRR